ncbi:hypothetical protein [Nocardiopsis trehalosi]|uniref:hypothetical protein n=1 Tax=Nocardiopsis trehalosi TaxID=109329 RepID=UPI001FDF028E|nr:hypothetical protein [Nocardiopsis trehalosi]
MTLDRYGHLFPDRLDLDEAAEAMDAARVKAALQATKAAAPAHVHMNVQRPRIEGVDGPRKTKKPGTCHSRSGLVRRCLMAAHSGGFEPPTF